MPTPHGQRQMQISLFLNLVNLEKKLTRGQNTEHNSNVAQHAI